MGLLNWNIVQQPVLYGFDGGSLVAIAVLLLRPAFVPPSLRARFGRFAHRTAGLARANELSGRIWAVTAVIAVAVGAGAGLLALVICESWLNVFGIPLDGDTRVWVVAAFAAVALAIANLWRSRWWRKAIAVGSVALFLATAALGINAGYGLNQTLGALLGMETDAPMMALPQVIKAPQQTSGAPLWQTWKPPAGMPTAGRVGPVAIPASASGFHARNAYLYLPPAALVAAPPPLPIIIMMMGQPGSPDQDKSAVAALNALAAKNHGLAPIFLTVDQLGNPYQNPVCVDSPSGNVYTYVTEDVVNFVRTKLTVSQNRDDWAVAGYSDGGECALSLAAKRPDLFGSLLDVSGELEPLDGTVQNTIDTIFRGNKAQYTAEEPASILKAHKYSDMLAIFTSGALDTTFTPQVAAAEADARAAGMSTYRFTGNNIGHRGDSVAYGLNAGLPLLYKRFGIVAP